MEKQMETASLERYNIQCNQIALYFYNIVY